MRISLYTLTILFILACGCFSHAKAQSFNFHAYTEELGLASNLVFHMAQDNKARMWFITKKGISIYDSRRWQTIPDSMYAPTTAFSKFVTGVDGKLWVFGQSYINNSGLVAFVANETSLTAIPVPAEFKSLTHAKVVAASGIYNGDSSIALAAENSLYLLNTQTLRWNKHTLTHHKGTIMALKIINNHIYLAGTHGIAKWNGQAIKYISPLHGVDKTVYNFEFFKNTDSLIVLGKNWFGVLKNDSLRLLTQLYTDWKIESQDIGPYGCALVTLPNNTIIFSNGQNHPYFYNISSNFASDIQFGNLLYSPWVTSIFADRENNWWFSSLRGLVKTPNPLFYNFPKVNIPPYNEITAIKEFKNGSLFLGTNNGYAITSPNGFINKKLDDKEKQELPFVLKRILEAALDKEGNIWFVSEKEGVKKLSPALNLTDIKLPVKSATAVYNYNDTLYIGNYIGDVFCMVNNRLVDKKTLPRQLYCRRFLKTRDTLFVATPLGLFFSAGNMSDFKEIGWQAHSRSIFALLEKDSQLLLGTEYGLYSYNNGTIQRKPIQGLDTSISIYAMTLRHGNQLVLGTNRGIYIIKNNKAFNYTILQGLAGNDVNRGALYTGSGNTLYIGTEGGLSLYLDWNHIEQSDPPFITFSHVNLPDRPISPFGATQLALLHDENNITFGFLSPSFIDEKSSYFLYQLEGFDTEWKHTVRDEVNYAKLPPGSYRFLVKRVTAAAESPVISTAYFVIKKPYYNTWWFHVLVVLILALIVWLLQQEFTKKKKQRVLEKEIAKIKAKIHEAEARFAKVWETIDEGLLIIGKQQTIIAANPAFARIMGATGNLQGLPVKELFVNSNEYEEIQKQIEYLPGNYLQNTKLQFEGHFKSGVKRLEYELFLLNSDNGEQTYLLTVRDITAWKQYEQEIISARLKAEEMSRLKTNFLANMNHEIRTPLSGILGATSILEIQHGSDSSLAEIINIINISGNRLLKTINSILDVSAIEANKVNADIKLLPVNDIIEKACLVLDTLAAKKKLLLVKKLDIQNPKAYIDKDLFEQILYNIISNGIKFTASGHIQVTSSYTADKRRVRIEIEDTGIGISDEFKNKMFDAFTQESSGYRRTFEGTGLGLAIVKGLIDIMKGELDVKSEKGKGTVFTLYFKTVNE